MFTKKQAPESAFVAPRNNLELQLTTIWQDVLGIQSIGIRDNLFELGGRSLLALQLLAQIEKTFQTKLPLSVLIQAPTIEQMAALIRKEGCASIWSSLVPIQPKGSKRPLFLIHPCSGEILLYRALAQHLGLDRPIYGLQAPGLDGKQTPYNRVEDMAAYYIQEIQNIQPEGPYFLGGLHIGAFVAFEMAQQLQKQGQTVQLLVLLDTRMRNLSRQERVFRNLGNLLQLGPKYVFDAVKGRIRWITGGIRRKLKKIKTANYKSSSKQSDSQTQPSLPKGLQKFLVQEFISEAFANYVPQQYTGQGVIFRAIDSRESQGVDRANKMGWNKLFSGRLAMHDLPGDHYSMLSEPHVRVLAEKLSVYLQGET
jgi:thioesterase domain-containing protein/acyl carrier protein